ncbi:MAG: outer membrane lipoprotein SlyB [Sulfurimonas sp.]|jgi:outer membrane lipoprotein SlyB|uniref:glycine zipper domain-containing protein n=1 Tax=Sulfurimonas sp. TaxID=2022749 RepID=UPI0039E6688F
MVQKALIGSLFFIFIFILSGCSTLSSPDASYEKTGTVENRVLSVKQGSGGSLGGMIGSVAGSFAGNDALSSALGAIVGGVAGSYVGKEVSRYDSSELSIGLDDGDSVMVHTKDLSIQNGDRVKVVKEANQFPTVEKIAY